MRVRLEQLGYRTLLIPDSSESPLASGRLIDGTLDGVIITTALLGSHLPAELKSRNFPFVLANREVEATPSDRCVVDNVAGARMVASLLVDQGHKEIGAIFGNQLTSTSRDRELGFRTLLTEKGIPLDPNLMRRGNYSYESGFSETLSLLDSSTRPTAIFCGNDVIALGACNALASRGLTPGRDVALVGFDDIPMAGWDLFRLTTVRGSFTTMAAESVRMLLERIQAPGRPHQRVVIEPQLVLRSSHHLAT
jgi:DNA-binding LacI/PurR family transcriptional regulator